ncbi:hypothetical protein Ae717Ps2_7297 [Pseudonocardia sp. Ae717_Ps2]|uniref:squalene cyclase n=1 Tax=Pseudonocardia sp. Ae717_Ps2 TaxID=1885573 RepID=UPI000964B25C|nr:hypothetical protein Ae717Ps2_7297 [Pseudonocardia sp. Ae717_Ps2]
MLGSRPGDGRAAARRQDPDGTWAGGAYFPAEPSTVEGQPWTATTWSLNALREWGLDPRALAGTAEKLESCRWEYDDLPYWDGEVDACINAWTVANGLWLGRDMDALAAWFAEHQLPDGGWNCDWVDGATRSSVHSTLNSLHGLLAHERATGGTSGPGPPAAPVRSTCCPDACSTGCPPGTACRSNGTPPSSRTRCAGGSTCCVAPSTSAAPRSSTARRPTRAWRRPSRCCVRRAVRDGWWVQGRRDPGEMWFEVDVPPGEPSPWLTLYGTRILAWWDAVPDAQVLMIMESVGCG